MCEFEERCHECSGAIVHPRGSCARHFVARSLGVENVPAELKTTDYDSAARVVREYSK
jgi:hypothetical protein